MQILFLVPKRELENERIEETIALRRRAATQRADSYEHEALALSHSRESV